MDTFEIDVLPKSGSGWPIVAKHKHRDDLVRDEGGTLELSDEQLQELERLSQLPQDYGALLGHVLFCDRVGRAFDRALARRKERLRVLLELWPKLGDGSVRKAAYRGGWKPA